MWSIVLKISPTSLLTDFNAFAMSFTEQLDVYCASKGVKISEKRRLVACELAKFREEIEAVDLFLHIRKKHNRISFPYIYQSLNWLVDAGFVLKKQGDNRSSLYSVIQYGI